MDISVCCKQRSLENVNILLKTFSIEKPLKQEKIIVKNGTPILKNIKTLINGYFSNEKIKFKEELIRIIKGN